MQSIFTGNPLSYLVCLSRCSRNPAAAAASSTIASPAGPTVDVNALGGIGSGASSVRSVVGGVDGGGVCGSIDRGDDHAGGVQSSGHQFPMNVSLKSMIEAIAENDAMKMSRIVTDPLFDVDSQDELGRTSLHHAIGHGCPEAVRCLIDHDADVNIKDETTLRETPLHLALRLGDVTSVQLILESASFDVIKCDSLHARTMFPETFLIGPYSTTAPANSVLHLAEKVLPPNCLKSRVSSNSNRLSVGTNSVKTEIDTKCPSYEDLPISARSLIVRRSAAECLLEVDTHLDEAVENSLVIIQDDGLTDFTLSRLVMHVGYRSLTSIYIVDCPLSRIEDDAAELLASSDVNLRTLVLSRTAQRRLPAALFRMTSLETLKVDRNRLTLIPVEIGRLSRLRTLCVDFQRPSGLRTLPTAAMKCLTELRVLSISGNRIDCINDWIGSMRQLRVLLCCRNRLTNLPLKTLSELKNLTVLDFRYNRIQKSALSSLEDLQALVDVLTTVRRFRGDLTSALSSVGIDSLRVGVSAACSSVDRAPQRLREVLFREIELRRHLALLASPSAGVNVENSCIREITIAIVGSTHAGKSSLVEALCSERGVCNNRGSNHHHDLNNGSSTVRNSSTCGKLPPAFSVRHFELKAEDAVSTSATPAAMTYFVTAIVVSTDLSFQFLVNRFSVDLFLLVVDLMSFDCSHIMDSSNGQSSTTFGSSHRRNNNHDNYQGTSSSHNASSRKLVSRQTSRLRMWLRALGETAADTPVLLVGTHAAEFQHASIPGGYGLLGSGSDVIGGGSDIWREFCDELLRPARREHASQYSGANKLPTCLLCAPTDASEHRQLYVVRNNSSSSKSKQSVAAGAGFVDLSARFNGNQTIGTSNGYVLSAASSVEPYDYDVTNYHLTYDAEKSNQKSTYDGLGSLRDRSALPHIVGYYELELTKAFPKETKRSGISGSGNGNVAGNGSVSSCNLSIELLRAAIVRHARPQTSGQAGRLLPSNLVPLSWVRFVRHLGSITERDANLTCLPLAEVIAIARSFDVTPTEASHTLAYFERRGLLFFGGGNGSGCSGDHQQSEDGSKQGSGGGGADDVAILRSTVVISMSWLFQTIWRVLHSLPSSAVRDRDLASLLMADLPHAKELERQLNRAGLITPGERIQWLLAVQRAFGMSIPIGRSAGFANLLTSNRINLFPPLLETGNPTETVWPETPNCDEKQVTCEVSVRQLRPGLFFNIQRQIASTSGMRQLSVIATPMVFMSHHIMFSTSLDIGGCADCFNIRRRLRPFVSGTQQHRQRMQQTCTLKAEPADTIDKVATAWSSSKVWNDEAATAPGDFDTGCGCCRTVSSSSTHIVHRVHIQLSSNLDFIRIQVRGVSPCCVMRTVIDFIDINLHDRWSPATATTMQQQSQPNHDNATDDCSTSTIRNVKPQPEMVNVRDSSRQSRWTVTHHRSSGVVANCMTSSSRRITRSSSRSSILFPNSGSHCHTPSESGDLDDVDDHLSTDEENEDDWNASTTAEEQRRLFVVCPKCILMRNSNPERIEYPTTRRRSLSSSTSERSCRRRRKPICSKWHNLGSWSRVFTGDYRPALRNMDGVDGMTSLAAVPGTSLIVGQQTIGASGASGGLYFGGAGLPDHEHPRLVLILPPTERISTTDWYVFSRARFLDGFDVHFLCEYTGYWHFVTDGGGTECRLGGGGSGSAIQSTMSGFAGNSTYREADGGRRPGSSALSDMHYQLPGALLRLAIPIIQCLRGVGEHMNNTRMLAPVVADLLDLFSGGGCGTKANDLEGVGSAGLGRRGDPSTWLVKHRDRLVTMLTKVLINAFYSETSISGSTLAAEVYNRCSSSVNSDAFFQTSSSSFSRSSLARFLRIDASTPMSGTGVGRFGGLRPVLVGREVRWVCKTHYEELRSMPSTPASAAAAASSSTSTLQSVGK